MRERDFLNVVPEYGILLVVKPKNKTKAALVFLSIVAAVCAAQNRTSAENVQPNQIQTSPPRIGLVIPVKSEQSIRTANGTITCEKGSLAFFLDSGQSAAFFNLNSQHKGDVKLTIGTHELKPLPGEEVVVTSDMAADFKTANPGKLISFRNPKVAYQDSNARIFTADFSIASAIMSIKQLKAMLHSEDSYQRHLINEVLKNHAIWTDTANIDGPYTEANQ